MIYLLINKIKLPPLNTNPKSQSYTSLLLDTDLLIKGITPHQLGL